MSRAASAPFLHRVRRVLRDEGLTGLARRAAAMVEPLVWKLRPPNPETLYDDAFFHGCSFTNAYCDSFADWLVQTFEPTSVLDVGCGEASLIRAMERRGVAGFGLDGSSAAVNRAPESVVVWRHDLTHPFLVNRRFSVVCCIEVAEHLPPRSATGLVASLAAHAEYSIVFTAAPPGQGGTGHLNERPRAYWLDCFGRVGWHECEAWTAEARAALQRAGAPDYIPGNLMMLAPNDATGGTQAK